MQLILKIDYRKLGVTLRGLPASEAVLDPNTTHPTTVQDLNLCFFDKIDSKNLRGWTRKKRGGTGNKKNLRWYYR